MRNKAKAKLLDISRATIGQTLVYKGQKYRIAAELPYTRADGVEIEMLEVHSHCAKCGEPFSFFRSRSRPAFYPTRRCKEHVLLTRRVHSVAAPKPQHAKNVFS